MFNNRKTERKPLKQQINILLSTLLLLGCSSEFSTATPVAADTTTQSDELDLGFIAFGDSGYNTQYLKKKQYTPLKPTKQAFIDHERAEWLKDGRDPAEFVSPPSEYVEAVGSMVDASGLYPVANAMKAYCANEDCEFSVMLGDNIYPNGATVGVDGKDDSTRFDDLFTKPFGDMGKGNEQYRIYTALGNHDWNTSREGAMAQVEFMQSHLPFYMDGIFYSVKPPAAKGKVEIFVIDTEVMLGGETVLEAELNPDGSEMKTDEVDKPSPWVVPQTAGEKQMVSWLDDKLKNSTAEWKLVVAHHPIWASGGSKFEQAKVLRRLILPSLCKYADIYFAGHEHTLELHEDSCETVLGPDNKHPLLQVLSGAAAKQRPVHTAFKAYQDKTYPEDNAIWVKGMTWGFSHIQLKGDMATVRMLTTPSDGSGDINLEYTYQYQRRTATLGKADR